MAARTAPLWYRRDLRIRSPALRAALDGSERRAGLLPRRSPAAQPACVRTRAQFLLESLDDLAASLRARGGGLVIRHARPSASCRRSPATPAPRPSSRPTSARLPVAEGERVADALRDAGIAVQAHPGLNVVDAVGALRTQGGKPYTVFSPFFRAWDAVPRRPVLGAPRRLRRCPRRCAPDVPKLADLGLEQEIEEPIAGGEGPGRDRLGGFLRGAVRDYADNHDALGSDKTSRLSAYLASDVSPPREAEHRLPGGTGAAAFRRQLCWRDFYHQVLLPLPPEREVGVPGALPRLDQMELRRRSLRGLVPGCDRLSARGRGHAAAAARGFHAQPRPARRRLLPHQGPRDRLALGRAGSCGCSSTATRRTTTATGSGSPRSAPTPSRTSGACTTARHMERFDPDGRYVRRRARAARRSR